VLKDLLAKISTGGFLLPAEVADAVEALTLESVDVAEKADFLCALSRRGETVAEISAFARELRKKSLALNLADEDPLLDVCGTGGDHMNTFNISTTVGIVAAAAGVKVAKHGNRGITSQCGSADVLEGLGVRTDLTPEEASTWIRQRGFAFLFAQRFHPAFKNIAPARKLCAERKERTVFNILGPLLNPAHPAHQLVGVSHPRFCQPMAQVLQELGVTRAMVVSGAANEAVKEEDRKFFDEISTLGPTSVSEFYQDRGFNSSQFSHADFGIPQADLSDLKGGDRETNVRIILAVLKGEEQGHKRQVVRLNGGAALFVAGRVRSIVEGIELVDDLLDSGAAFRKLEELRQP